MFFEGFGEGGPGHTTSWEIRVVTPGGRVPVSWPRGSTQTIAWRIDGGHPPERVFLVTLKRGADTVLTIPSERPIWDRSSESYSLSWPIPADLPLASDYRIKVVDRNGPTEGISESEFSITRSQGIGEGGPGHPTSWAIQEVFPRYLGVDWPLGSIKTITWRIDGEYPSERAFLVTLKRGARSVKTFPGHRAVWNGPVETYSLKCVMPTDVPLASDYRIKVVDRNGLTEGISESEFSVTRPIYGIEVGLEDLEVHSLYPSSGFLYRVGQPLNFRISSSRLVEVTAQLVPVEEQFRWRSRSIPLRDFGGSFTTAAFSWTPPPETPVGDYRIYVTGVIVTGTTHGGATGTGHAYSEPFHLYAPIPDPVYEINVTSPVAGQIVSIPRPYSLFLIMWHGCGFPEGTLFTRILYKGSVELQRIGPDERCAPSGRPCSYETNFNVSGYASGSDYHVRVEAWSLDGTELLASDNSENFTFINLNIECNAYQPLVIRRPNNYASEVRVIGCPLSIAWCHYPDASPDQRIRLQLVRDTAFGGEWEINSSIPSFPSQTTWVIPTSVPPGDGYRVRAEQIGGTGVATSANTFSISNQPLAILSPNNYASEVVRGVIGRPLSIAWCHPDASPDQRIRLLLVRDIAFGGGEWEINSSIPSSPSQTTWVIPTLVPPGDGYRVRAEQIGGTGVSTSARTFSILGYLYVESGIMGLPPV